MINIISVMERDSLNKLKNLLIEKGIRHKGIITPREIVIKEELPLCHSSLLIYADENEIKKALEGLYDPQQHFINRMAIETKSKTVFVEEVYNIIRNLKEAYLALDNNRPFIFTSSFGKDSCMQLYCMWLALQEIKVEYGISAFKRKVYVVSSDTGLEMPEVRDYMHNNIKLVQQYAEKEQFPVQTQIVYPEAKASFGPKVIGKGVVPSSGRSSRRNCTFWWKIQPMDRLLEEIVEKHGEIVIFLGVRNDESEKRKQSISKYEQESFIFPHTKKKQFACHPIKYLTTEELWDTLKVHQNDILPFGVPFDELFSFYESSNECPVQISTQSKQSCGTNRNGCFSCMMVEEDKMLLFQRDVQKKTWAVPLLEFRNKFRSMLFDCHFRRHPSKHKSKQSGRYNPFIETKEEVIKGNLGKASMLPKRYQNVRESKIFRFYRENKGLIHGTTPVYPNVMTGSLSLEARILLLKNALWYQRLAGVEFIPKEHVELIKEAWKDEFGWIENDEDLKPEPIDLYDENWGVLEIDENFQVKIRETTIPNLHLPVEYNYTRNDNKSGKKKGECRILNEDPTKNTNYVFYVHREFGNKEQEILDILEKAEKSTRIVIPFFFNNGWTTQNNMREFWNLVSFVVCKPNIKSTEEAEQYVERYIECGLPKQEMVHWR